MNITLAEVIILMAAIAPILACAALADLLNRPQDTWALSGQNRLVWTFLVSCVAVLGPLVYMGVALRKLNTVTSSSNGLPNIRFA